MKYSKGVDATILQILYLIESLSFGMYLSKGRAEIAKSMQDFCLGRIQKVFSFSVKYYFLWFTYSFLKKIIFKSFLSYLIFINITILELSFTLLLKRNDN